MTGSVGAAIDRHRLVVCVGTGGVGKTTLSAAIALGAALRGRRAMVLTIDPARALARSLGLASLAPGGEPVPAAALAAAGLAPRGVLSAGMLDQKQAWDAFVARHAPTPSVARALYDNPFYQRLSTSFSGSTEYMAIEEMCRLAESGRHDLIVLDTPPAAHALDFLRAPARIDRLLDRGETHWLAEATGRGALRSAGVTARFVLRRLERAAGQRTLRDISTFFVALDALVDAALARTRRARAMLAGGDAAFVLVAGPRQLVLDETRALAARLDALHAPLAAVVLNRVHPVPAATPVEIEAGFAAIADAPPPVIAWLRAAWDDTVADATREADQVARFVAALPPTVALARVPEAPRDLHALGDLAAVAATLWA
jgi:anion-transporting  ArsA/GET3 family ATPase